MPSPGGATRQRPTRLHGNPPSTHLSWPSLTHLRQCSPSLHDSDIGSHSGITNVVRVCLFIHCRWADSLRKRALCTLQLTSFTYFFLSLRPWCVFCVDSGLGHFTFFGLSNETNTGSLSDRLLLLIKPYSLVYCRLDGKVIFQKTEKAIFTAQIRFSR